MTAQQHTGIRPGTVVRLLRPLDGREHWGQVRRELSRAEKERLLDLHQRSAVWYELQTPQGISWFREDSLERVW